MGLTNAKLKSIHGNTYSGKPEITDGDGLSIRISTKGKISFQIRYRYEGKPVRLKLGEYPIMTLSEARSERDKQMEFVKKKRDPRSLAMLEPQSKATATIQDCIDYWYANYCLLKRDRPSDILKRVNGFVSKEWAKTYIEEMTILDFSNFFKSLNELAAENKAIDKTEQGCSGAVHNSIIELRTVFRYCVRQGYIKNTFFESLRPGDFAKPYQPRERALNNREIGVIWNRCSQTSLGERNQVILKLAMVFGCRMGELANAKKTDFNLKDKIWTVPREFSKNKIKSIKRPIPEKIIPIIERAFELAPVNVWVFPNRTMTGPVSVSSLSKIAVSLCEYLNIDHFVNHDFRRTLSTHLTDLQCPIYITEKILGHHLKGILGVYNKSDMLEEMAYWLDVWVSHIEKCTEIKIKQD